ncbi:MAG TPA: hypothetical protein VK556_09705 [Candidatus Udaeobacter sp.]|jgi:hypothetical protein|nr:hypothetical protein [Candidatus Udaeobacter sp.]
MDDIQKRADDKAWDEKQNRRISDANRRIEDGVTGEALAALHGLHVSPDDEGSYDVDEISNVADQETLRDKIISRLIQIGDTISRNRDLPDDVRQRWTATLQEIYASDAKSVTLLRDLRREINSWEEIDPQSEFSLVYGAIGAVATMIEIYQRRFNTR